MSRYKQFVAINKNLSVIYGINMICIYQIWCINYVEMPALPPSPPLILYKIKLKINEFILFVSQLALPLHKE